MVGAHKRVFLFFEEESKRLRAEERCGKLCRGLLCDGLTGLVWPCLAALAFPSHCLFIH